MALRRACAFPQGLGLYAARDIEKHTMVIEYIGTIIRNEVANRKEKLYESQVSPRPPAPGAPRARAGCDPRDHTWIVVCFPRVFCRRYRLRGCHGISEPGLTGDANGRRFLFQNRGVYMFRMDSDHVIDATLTGGPAR